MSWQRIVILVSGVLVFGLAGVFCALSWSRADQLAGIVSALVSVAGLGATVWAAIAAGSVAGAAPRLRATRTGNASARSSGSANTGVITSASGTTGGTTSVNRTGDAEAEDGQANTGIAPQ
jgi:hypothetical protein